MAVARCRSTLNFAMEEPNDIDGEHLPFTEDEVRRALVLADSPEEAEQFAAEIAGLVKTTDEMVRAAEAARARGSTG